MTYTVTEAYEMAQNYHNKLVEQEFDQAKEELENLIDSAIKTGNFAITTEPIIINEDTVYKLAEYFKNLGYLITTKINGIIPNNYVEEIRKSYSITIRWDAAVQVQW